MFTGESPLQALDRKAIVVEQGLQFDWEELSLGQSCDLDIVSLVALHDHAYMHDLRSTVIVERLAVLVLEPVVRVYDWAAAVDPGGVARQRAGIWIRDIKRESAACCEVTAHAGQSPLHVPSCIQMHEDIEGGYDKRESALQRQLPDISGLQHDPGSNSAVRSGEPRTCLCQHALHAVDTNNLESGFGHTAGHASGTYAEFKHRAAVASGELHIVPHVGQTAAVTPIVVRPVAVVRFGAFSELTAVVGRVDRGQFVQRGVPFLWSALNA